MNGALIGLVVGMALAFAAWFGGFGAFLLVAALGAIGFAAGRMVDDGLDWREFLRGADRRRR
ncbi:complement resistance protein TraT [Streptomyces tubbatahanensis]|uniref:Complement resistance protein TraT n=1 Tax=Streptomyces tubbatahanensis TaxID=2923272 RepID=A0ABY3XZL8_9ACTN|nr:complement resistance protein TraT [Streptomyces tubbatahanensis]UNS99917.1 complement resistance protein TraT [Streptomyces tubbatahanensis]